MDVKRFGWAGLPLLLALSACGGDTSDLRSPQEQRRDEVGSITGEGGVFGGLFGASTPREEGAGIGVNAFLWRASLDTISFMPLVSADPFGGVIITDWFSPAETPDERFKVSVFLLSRQLRADAVRVSVFRQQRQGEAWLDQPVASKTGIDLEDAILSRARQLRLAQADRQ